MITTEWLALALFALYALIGVGTRSAVQIRRTGALLTALGIIGTSRG